jgi:hypothetical protein
MRRKDEKSFSFFCKKKKKKMIIKKEGKIVVGPDHSFQGTMTVRVTILYMIYKPDKNPK